MMIKPCLLNTLKILALMGACDGWIELSSSVLAEKIGVSQQTASRYLVDLDDLGLISRRMGVRKQRIRLLPKGFEVLREEHSDYRRIFEFKDELHILGRVTSGMEEGKYYTEQEEYVSQFKSKLGFDPFPGTLNVVVDDSEVNKLRILKKSDGILINGFARNDRSFGSVICFRTKIDGVSGAIVLPVRSHYSKVLELISSFHLRDKLKLRDGDKVELVVSLKGN